MRQVRWWLVAALLPTLAFAGEVSGASPRMFYLEFKASPFTPLIDQHFSSPGPYEKTFGKGFMWLGEAELDFQFFQRFGSLGVGLSVGYAEKYGKSFVVATGVSSTEATGLMLVPLKLLLVYRFDWLNAKYNIPLVPYLKGGPVGIPWWVTKGGNLESVVANGTIIKGSGFKTGLAGVVGLALCLDFLDPRLARDFDTSVGVNHSYLFAEWTYQNTLVFEPSSNRKPLDLSSRNFSFGLGLEF